MILINLKTKLLKPIKNIEWFLFFVFTFKTTYLSLNDYMEIVIIAVKYKTLFIMHVHEEDI
jgi:hypothetical protein